jgi:hypothetical protein
MSTATRALGIARTAVAAVIFAFPGAARRLFAGPAGATAAVSIFARGSAADAVAVAAAFGRLPPPHRAVAAPGPRRVRRAHR